MKVRMVLFASLVGVSVMVSGVQCAYAKTGSIPEKPGSSFVDGVESWKYIGGSQGVGGQITAGSRKDTVKVNRTITYRVKGAKRNVNLNIEKRISLKYEVYSRGSRKGRVARVYKPTTTIIEKECRYLGVFRLTTSTKSLLMQYGATSNGHGVTMFEEHNSFKLPRQFPLKRDGLTELLRQAFSIDLGSSTKIFNIVPSGSYGKVVITNR